MKLNANYFACKTTRVICPECGAGGGNSGPCYCHNCDGRVMMLPACNDRITGNWIEHLRNEGINYETKD